MDHEHPSSNPEATRDGSRRSEIQAERFALATLEAGRQVEPVGQLQLFVA